MTIGIASNLGMNNKFEPQGEANIELFSITCFYIILFHLNIICIEDVVSINTIYCIYIWTIWLKVEIRFLHVLSQCKTMVLSWRFNSWAYNIEILR